MARTVFGREPADAPEWGDGQLHFRQVMEHIREVFFLVDPQISRMYYISPAYAEIWGRSCESLYAEPKSFADAIHVDDRQRAFQAFAPHGTVIPFDIEYRIVRPDQTLRWIRARGFPVRNEHGHIYRFAGFAEDITASKNANELVERQARVLARNNRRLALLGEMTGLLQTVARLEDAASLVSAYLAQIGVGSSGAVYLYKESRNYLDVLARWGEARLPDSFAPDECWALRRGQVYEPAGDEAALRCKHAQGGDGAPPCLCLPMMVEGGALGLMHVLFEPSGEVGADEDKTFAQRMSEQLGLALANLKLRQTLRLESMHDPLTNLCNRRFLETTLNREFARAARENTDVAVLMLDVDNFKRFNDTHGHDAGDMVLRQLGQALMENCRASDLACRFGGEEFTVVLPAATRPAAAAWAERLMERIRHMKTVVDGALLPTVTVSIGIASFPADGEETAAVIQAADQALYEAKRAGRNRYVLKAGASDEHHVASG